MKLLIACDGSASSEYAVSDLQLAGLPFDTEAVVLSVLDGRICEKRRDGGGSPDQALLDFENARERQLAVAEQGARMARGLFPNWRVTAEVRVGNPAWEIIQRAEGSADQGGEKPFDLVVVGSRGHGELKRLLLGSVAHRVLTTLRGSVRVSRGRPDRFTPPAGSGAGFAPPRVIVGVDGSRDAHAAVDAVAHRHWPGGTRVVIASFETGPVAAVGHWEPNTIWGGVPHSSDSAAMDARPALRAVTKAAELVRSCRPELIVQTVVKPGDPKYALIGAAEAAGDDGADCIFLGASGVRGLARFLLGSVSVSVALNAACSVEVVQHPPGAG